LRWSILPVSRSSVIWSARSLKTSILAGLLGSSLVNISSAGPRDFASRLPQVSQLPHLS
jgi:hypothetical protein